MVSQGQKYSAILELMNNLNKPQTYTLKTIEELVSKLAELKKDAMETTAYCEAFNKKMGSRRAGFLADEQPTIEAE